MPRLLFEKCGNAIWISHLDLMRLFQRAFKRAGLPLTHTQGFNPRPSVSIALPLSVGVESKCELLDFDLYGESIPCEQIKERLNQALVSGVTVLSVYEQTSKVKNIAYLECELILEYDSGVPACAANAMRSLFSSDSLIVEKKGKNGVSDQDLIPLIQGMKVMEMQNQIILHAMICCQNPSLNPTQLYAAIVKYLPECQADYVRYRRLEVYDANQTIFR